MICYSAASSALGYYYQGCYALVSLLDCEEDNATVSIETRDDIELVESGVTLLKQLKHKPGSPSPVSLKSDDIWNTIRIWCQFLDEPEFYFHFITTKSIKSGDTLEHLIRTDINAPLSDDLVETVAADLTTEAERVHSAREKAKKENKSLPYKVRWSGCHAYLKLNESARMNLVRRTNIMPEQFLAADIQVEVEKRLKFVLHTIRCQVAERLIEWWDRELAKALLKQRQRSISNNELRAKIAELVTFLHDDRLIDDYSSISAPEGLTAPLNVARQIKWVGGGEEWITRATKARWRAQQQRDRWLGDGMAAIQKLDRFDEDLKEEWRDRFDDRKVDCRAGRKKPDEAGFELLRWSWYDAPKDVPPIQVDWRNPYLTRGTYQEMSNRFQVGWHPQFESLKEAEENDSKASD